MSKNFTEHKIFGSGVSTVLKNVQSKIIIYSFSVDKMIYFPAFVTDFSDAFTSNWNSTEVYGKMDPISTFKSTTRTINISFDIPNYGTDVIYNNANLDDLVSGLYPIYNKNDNGTSLMTSPPLFRIKFANLIENNGYRQKKDKTSNDNDDDPRLEKGLLGFFKSFDYKPDFAQGVYELEDKIFPKLIKVSLSFNVIHEHSLGNQIIGNNKSTRNQVNGPNTFPHRFDISNEKLAPAPKEGSSGTLPTPKPPARSPGGPGGLLEGAPTPEQITAALRSAGGIGVSELNLLDESGKKIVEKVDNPPSVVSDEDLLRANLNFYNLPPSAQLVGSRIGSIAPRRETASFRLDTPLSPRRSKKKGANIRTSNFADTLNLVDGDLKKPIIP